jgi:hypothetical protein
VTFRIPRPNVIESEDGFSVEVLGRTGLRYREAGKVVFIDSEILATPSGLAVYPQRMKLEGPSTTSTDSLDQKERARIEENVLAALKFAGFVVQVVKETWSC